MLGNIGAFFLFAFKNSTDTELFATRLLCCSIFTSVVMCHVLFVSCCVILDIKMSWNKDKNTSLAACLQPEEQEFLYA